MNTFALNSGRVLRMRPVAACLAVALGATAATAVARPAHTPNLVVSNCDDSGSGSLRATVAGAASGDTIDMSQLACSTISLVSGAIVITQDTLYLTGPGADALTVDGQLDDRVFHHTGTGTLSISDLSVKDGKYVSSTRPSGGCIDSAGNVELSSSTVSGCVLVGQGDAVARGGGVYTEGNLSLLSSTLSGNFVSGSGTPVGNSDGGAAFVRGDFVSKYSTITRNEAYSVAGHNSGGGGVKTYGGVTIAGSTVSANHAAFFGALVLVETAGATASITNSTISGNSAHEFSAVYTQIPLTLSNSTIAFNRAIAGRGALYTQASTLDLQSSIVAGNENIGVGVPDDVNVNSGTIVGANNLITSSTAPLPADTITDCPRLGPLADNGGTTLTHALLHTSPAIDAGNNAQSLSSDQRGSSRVSGPATDIGAYEWQGGSDESLLLSGFEPVCDQ